MECDRICAVCHTTWKMCDCEFRAEREKVAEPLRARLALVESENKRLRAALEDIASDDCAECHLSQIASEALAGETRT